MPIRRSAPPGPTPSPSDAPRPHPGALSPRKLRKAMRDPAWVADQDARALLLSAAKSGVLPALAHALERGAPPDAPAYGGWTPAMLAAARGHGPCLRALLAAGADPDAKNSHGWTGAMWAALRGHEDCLKMLIATGADLGATNLGREDAHLLASGGGEAGELFVALSRARRDAHEMGQSIPQPRRTASPSLATRV